MPRVLIGFLRGSTPEAIVQEVARDLEKVLQVSPRAALGD